MILQAVLADILQSLPAQGAACFLLANHGRGQGVGHMAFANLPQSYVAHWQDQPTAVAQLIHTAVANEAPVHIPPDQTCQKHGYHTLLCAPIFTPPLPGEEASKRALGAFLIFYTAVSADFTPQEKNLLQSLGRQLSLTLERADLLATERQTRVRMEALQEVQAQLSRTLDLNSVFDALLVQVRRVVPYDTANLTLFQYGQLEVIRTAGYEESSQPDITGTQVMMSQIPTLKHIWQTQEVLVVADTDQHPDWWHSEDTAYIKSWIGVPIIIDDEVVAVMGLDKRDPNFYNADMAHLLESFAAQGAIAMRNAQLFDTKKRQTEQLTHLHQLTRAMSRAETTASLCQTVADNLHEAFNFEYVAIFAYRPARQRYVLTGLAGLARGMYRLHEYNLSSADSLLSTAVETERILQATAPALDDHFVGVRGLGLQAQIVIPLLRAGLPLGVLTVASASPDGLKQADVDILQNITDQLTDALDKLRLLDTTQQHLQELEALFNLSAELRQAYTLSEIAETVVQHACTAVGAAGANFWHQASDDTLVMKACLPRHPMSIGSEIEDTAGLVGRAFQQGEILVTNDLSHVQQAYANIVERRLMSNAQASIVIPINTAETRSGVLNVWFREQHREFDLETRLLTAVVELAANALERADLLASLERRVTERTRELEEANERLQELDQLKSRFVAEVTHELRTPTANLRLYLDLFNRTDKPEKQARYVEVLNKQTERLEHLVENILYLSRLDMSKDTLNFTALKLQDVVEQVLLAVAEQAEEAALSLTFESLPVPQILGERNQLAQMVTNLVDNAILYTDAGGTVQIRLSSPSPDIVRLEIQDNGQGIEFEDWDYIFSRFYRGQNATQSNIPGRGLGLAIVKEIADLHHGRVEMESTPGEGSTFRIDLPAINLQKTILK